MDVGSQIRRRRAERGLSQDELAERLYVSRVTVSHWETGKTLPDVQSLLLLANLFDTTIDDLVKGDVEEMRDVVEKDDRKTMRRAAVLGVVVVAEIVVLISCAVWARDALGPVTRMLAAVHVLALAVVLLAARGDGEHERAASMAEVLGAATGEPAERAKQGTGAQLMTLALQAMAGFGVGLAVVIVGGLLLEPDALLRMILLLAAVAALAGSYMLGRFGAAIWTATLLPGLWAIAVAVLAVSTGGAELPGDLLALAGGAAALLLFWVTGRSRREASKIHGSQHGDLSRK